MNNNNKYPLSLSLLLLPLICLSMNKPSLPMIKLKGHDGDVVCALFSPKNKYIGSCSYADQNNLMLWSKRGKQLHNLMGHNKEVSCIKFTSDSTKIISGSNGESNNLKIWDTQTGLELYNLEYHTYRITALDCNNNNIVISASADNKKNLALWNGATGQLLHALIGHTGGIDIVQFHPNGETFASSNPSWSGGPEQTIFIWNTQGGQKIKKLSFKNVNTDLSFNKDLTQFAAGRFFPNDDSDGIPSMNCILTVWNTNDSARKPKNIFVGHRTEIAFAQFNKDSTKIVSGSMDDANTLIVWDNISGEIIHNLINPDHNPTSAVIFSPSDKYIVSGGYTNKNIFIWDARKGKILYNLGKHNRTFSLCFSKNEKYLISAGADGELILWRFNADEKQEIKNPLKF